MIFVVYVFCGFVVCCRESLPCSGVSWGVPLMLEMYFEIIC